MMAMLATKTTIYSGNDEMDQRETINTDARHNADNGGDKEQVATRNAPSDGGTNCEGVHVPNVWMGATTKLLAKSCPTLALAPVFRAKAFCRAPTRICPIGALTKKP
jgi:hypothetical protein